MNSQIMMNEQCPYGAEDCPKVARLEDDLKSIKRCLYVVVLFLACEFGTRFLEAFV